MFDKKRGGPPIYEPKKPEGFDWTYWLIIVILFVFVLGMGCAMLLGPWLFGG